MSNIKRYLLSLLVIIPTFLAVNAQTQELDHDIDSMRVAFFSDSVFDVAPQVVYDSVLDSLLANAGDVEQLKSVKPLPRWFFLPLVYTKYLVIEAEDPFTPDFSGNPALEWVEEAESQERRMRDIRQYALIANPTVVKYNIRTLPNPPKEFTAVVNNEEHTIEIIENSPGKADLIVLDTNKGLIHWLHTFNGILQFSQAYISPNWYQGGNNNLNMISNLNYNVKLNQKLHPTLLFETTVQYKLAVNSAPDDSLRNYNISEDLFQINSTFGLKAVKKWYYTVNFQFKTQLLNSYKKNTRDLRSAFMSPGELNAGVGMTYNTANKKKTFTFDASISPLSYNLMICTNNRINKASFNIDPDRTTSSKYGSSAECKISWQMASNIKLSSRLFAFTDYSRFYADLENTLVFEINKYLTSQIFAHLRYDTLTPYVDPEWHKLQIKEILSLGFAYKFSTL